MLNDPPVSSQLQEFLDQKGERGREMLLPALLETQKIHDFIPPASASDWRCFKGSPGGYLWSDRVLFDVVQPTSG